MSAKLLIDTHGGISGITDFSIIIKPKKKFALDFSGITIMYEAIKYTGNPNRQCYKCAFCHSIDLCSHFICTYHGEPIKFKIIK